MKNNSKYKILLETIPDNIPCCLVLSVCGSYISITNAKTSQTIGIFLVDDSLKIQLVDNKILLFEQQRLSQKLIQYRFQNNNTQKFLHLISEQLSKHAQKMKQKQLNDNNHGRVYFKGQYFSNYPLNKSIESVQLTIDYQRRMLEVNLSQDCEKDEYESKGEIISNDHSAIRKIISPIKQIELSRILDVLVGIKTNDIQWFKFNKDIQFYLCVSILFSENSFNMQNASNQKIISTLNLQLSSYSNLKSFLIALQNLCAPFNCIFTNRELAFHRVREILRQEANVNKQMTFGAYLRSRISNGKLQDENQDKQTMSLNSYFTKQDTDIKIKNNPTCLADLVEQQKQHTTNDQTIIDLSVFKVNPQRISKGSTQLQFYERFTPNDSGNHSRRN